MTSRQDFIYELAGRITEKRTKKTKEGNNFYQLAVVIENKDISKINVFQDSTKEKIWQKIEKSKYLGKKYLFYCKNFMGTYYLIDWQEIKNHETQ